jgi:hypothetical protein
MQRYFFDFRQGDEFTRDAVGSEFPTAETAYLEAYKAAEAMWSELLACRRDPRRCSFEVRASDGDLLFVLPFGELLDSCYDRIKPQTHAIADTVGHFDNFRRAHKDLLEELERARNTLRQSAALLAKA